MRGSESDYSLGLSDNLQEEVNELGGEVVLVAKLHAKIYMADRKEAIVTSANLTKGGTEANYEGGIWVNDPVVLKEICTFLDDILIGLSASSPSSSSPGPRHAGKA